MHIGIAKSDGITALKRFVDKSEPTWMFIAKRQMVQLVFGSNAPLIQKTILTELKKEKECMSGERERVERSPEEYSDEERERYFDRDEKIRKREEKIKEKAFKTLTEHRMAQSKNILDTMAHVGLILIWPHATRSALEILDPYLKESNIAISKKERPTLTEEAMEDIEFFAKHKIPEYSRKQLFTDKCLTLMMTQNDGGASGPVDDAVLQFVYGDSKTPPGDVETPASILTKKPEIKNLESDETLEDVDSEEKEMTEEEKAQYAVLSVLGIENIQQSMHQFGLIPDDDEEEEEEQQEDIWGCWAPGNELVKATAMKYFFPLITAPLILPEPEPIPPHIVVAFDACKKEEVLSLANEHPIDVMAFGFFTDENCDDAKLIAKSKSRFEKVAPKITYGEKLILKVSKKHSDTMLAFAQLGPTYLSPNIEEGERECAVFFPEDYVQDDEVVEEELPPEPKKKKKKSRTSETSDRHEVEESSSQPIMVGVEESQGQERIELPEGEVPTTVEGVEGEVPPAVEGAEGESPREHEIPAEESPISELPGVEESEDKATSPLPEQPAESEAQPPTEAPAES